MADKNIYAFGGDTAEGAGKGKELLGGKGYGLAEMSLLGIPVPPGFTITTEVCTYYQAHDSKYPETLTQEVEEHLVLRAELGRQALLEPGRHGRAPARRGDGDHE